MAASYFSMIPKLLVLMILLFANKSEQIEWLFSSWGCLRYYISSLVGKHYIALLEGVPTTREIIEDASSTKGLNSIK